MRRIAKKSMMPPQVVAPCSFNKTVMSGVGGMLLELELPRPSEQKQWCCATEDDQVNLSARFGSRWVYHDAIQPHASAAAPALLHLLPPPLRTQKLKQQIVGCMGLRASEMADLLGTGSSDPAAKIALPSTAAPSNKAELVQQLRTTAPSQWRDLSAALGPIPTQTVFSAIGVNPAFGMTGDAHTAAHNELLFLIQKRHSTLMGTPSEQNPDTILLESGCLRGLRKVYLRSLKVVEFCAMQRLVFELQRTLSAKARSHGRSSGDDLDHEQLEFFTVMPARRECTLDKADQWNAVLSNLRVALPLLKRRSNVLRMTSNVALFLKPRGAVLRVRELLEEVCTICEKDEQIAVVELHESVTAVVSAALNKVQTAKVKDISETLDVLSLVVGIKGRLPAEGTVGVEHVRHELRQKATDDHLDSGAAIQCLSLIEGIAAQLLAVIPPHVPDMENRQSLATKIMKWIDDALHRMPSVTVSFNSLQLPRIAKLLAGSNYQSRRAAAALQYTWECGCGALSVAGNPCCIQCTISNGEGSAMCSKPGCGTHLVKGDANCGVCRKEHPHHAAARKYGEWWCAECDRRCPLRYPCEECGEQDPEELAPCDVCGTEQARSTTLCETCGHSTHSLKMHMCNACHGIVVSSAEGAIVATGSGCAQCSNIAPGTPLVDYAVWQCGCGTVNPPTSRVCRSCPAHSYTCDRCGHLSEVSNGKLTKCSNCGELHPQNKFAAEKTVTQCPGCHEVTPIQKSCANCNQVPIQDLRYMLPKFSAMPWQCHHCGTSNALRKGQEPMICGGCGADRIGAALFAETDAWRCPRRQCRTLNHGYNCSACGTLHPNVPRESVFVWECAKCQMPNNSWEKSCHRAGCDGVNPALSKQSAHPSKQKLQQPWTCDGCGAWNKPLNTKRCRRCRKQRPKPKCSLCGQYHLTHQCPPEATEARLRRVEELLMASYNSKEPSVDDMLQHFMNERRDEGKDVASLELPVMVAG